MAEKLNAENIEKAAQHLEDIQTGIDTAINKESGSIKVHIKQW